jgi:hypothetical protein
MRPYKTIMPKKMKISLGKLFLFLVFLGGLLFLLRPIGDPDFWWHIKTGQLIHQEQQIPYFDTFSFTANGKTWIAHEWLSEVILYLTYRIGGIPLTQIIFALFTLVAFGLSIARTNNRTNLYSMGCATLLGLILSTPVLWARPQIFSLLYFSIFLFLLNLFLKNEKIKYIIPLPFLMVLWVNQHGAFIVGLGLICIFIFGLMIDKLRTGSKEVTLFKRLFPRQIIVLCFLLFVCLLSSLINPNGIKMLVYPFITINDPSLQAFNQEWASPNFHERTWIPLAVMIMSLIGFGPKAKKEISSVNIILCVIFCYLALMAVKQVAFFAIVSIPVLSDLLTEVFPFKEKVQKSRVPVLVISILSIAGLLTFGVYELIHLEKKQTELMTRTLPINSVQFIKDEGITGKIFNSYNWGGYLIWNLYPQTRVYIDGRCDMYGANFVTRYVDVYTTKPGWQKALLTDGIEYVLIEPNTYLAYALYDSAEWRSVFSDNVSVLFERIAP